MSYNDGYNDPKRIAIVNTALVEASKRHVHAKAGRQKDDKGKPLGWGWEALLEYLRVAAPNLFNEDVIKHLVTPGRVEPMQHWCGIFALWAIKTAGMQVGTWREALKHGSGISSVTGFRPTARPKAGDVAYVNHPAQHHVIVHRVWTLEKGGSIQTIEGNSGQDSEFTFGHTFPKSRFSGFYTAFYKGSPNGE